MVEFKSMYYYFIDIPPHIGLTLLKWVYTDDLELNKPDHFFLDLMRFAKRFDLKSLVER